MNKGQIKETLATQQYSLHNERWVRRVFAWCEEAVVRRTTKGWAFDVRAISDAEYDTIVGVASH